MSNTLTELNAELDNQVGFTERIRLTPESRISAINQAVEVVYGLLSGSPVLKSTGSITISSSGAVSPVTGIGTLPSDFNEGRIFNVYDSTDFDNAKDVRELDEHDFWRWDDTNDPVFKRAYNASTNDEELHFKGVSSGTYYIEYERGAPELSNADDTDRLPRQAKRAIGKIASGILTDNILADQSKMQVMLYGPSGNPGRCTPDSVMGILSRIGKTRRIEPRRSRTTMINII